MYEVETADILVWLWTEAYLAYIHAPPPASPLYILAQLSSMV